VKWLPSWKNALLALLAAGLLILAFPDFEWWWTAWFALVPLMWAVERDRESTVRSFLLGWLFGTAFFFGTCWWLTYAPIHYAAVPWPIAYFLILIACLGAGVFPGIFAAILSILLRRFGSWAFLAAPFVWVFSEFLRYWVTGNNWNAVGYSQFNGSLAKWASTGGVLAVSFGFVFRNLVSIGLVLVVIDIMRVVRQRARDGWQAKEVGAPEELPMFRPINDGSDDDLNPFLVGGLLAVFVLFAWLTTPNYDPQYRRETNIVAVQPNVPMSGLDQSKLGKLRQQQIENAEAALRSIEEERQRYSSEVPAGQPRPTLVILPESPMNFMYNDDREFQQFIGEFARRNNVSVLFNSAEPDSTNGKYFNSAVMVGPDGKKLDQYDKLYLLPFGEAVPRPLEAIVPAFVGNFSYGREYDLLPVGDAKAGVMICFESHFGQLSREYVRNGADVIIEMTNDGYLGPTPVLRQHLANAVFRAVETNRPVLRVTNVGITTYITENGTVLDPLPVYQEGTRVWSVSKSDGSQTFYVKYGDWFAWLCSLVTFGLVMFGLLRKDGREVDAVSDI
jgi:apolipoprotein N-acyltransferase